MTARKMKGAKQEAKRASGMSRRCAKCPFKNKYDCCPSEMHLMHCHEVFVEAFVKGAKWYRDQMEKRNNESETKWEDRKVME